MKINNAFLIFRCRQIGGFVKELPVPYLVIILLMVAAFLLAVYAFMGSREGALMSGCGVLLPVYLIHIRRKDYHFVCLVDTGAWRVFFVDYLLISWPVMLLGIIQGSWYVLPGLVAGCGLISLIRQPSWKTGKGFPVPSIIPWELFEFRAGFRKYGGWLLLMYVGALVGLLLPYLSFAFLWFFTAFFVENFRVCESKAVLCSRELPAGRFIHRKLWTYGCFFMLFVLPICLLYAGIRPAEWWLPAAFLILASLNVLVSILYKYAVYEPEKKIVGGMSLAISFIGILVPVLAPFTLLLLIRYYSIARKNVKPYLYAYY